jgi:putative transposase
VESERHLLACCYVELNPVRAGMVHAPGDYRWSSYGSNAAGRTEPPKPTHCAATPNSSRPARFSQIQ